MLRPRRRQSVGSLRCCGPGGTGALACDAVAASNAQALAKDDASNSLAPKKRWFHTLLQLRTLQNRWLTASFRPRTSKRWFGTMFSVHSIRVAGSQRGFEPVRASVGLGSSFHPVLSKAKVLEYEMNAAPNSNREALVQKGILPHTIEAGCESLSKRKRPTNLFSV